MLIQFLNYKLWANEVMFDSLRCLPVSVLTDDRPIIFGSILRTLNHVCVIDQVWKAHLSGRAHDIDSRNPETCPTLAEIESSQKNLDRWFISYAKKQIHDKDNNEPRLDPLNTMVFYRSLDDSQGSMTRSAILHHVVNHATYHRGQIADMLYMSGLRPPATDLPIYLSENSLNK